MPRSWERTEKEVVRIRAEATDLEDLDQVEELAVNVSDDRDRGGDVYHIALLHEKLFCLCAYCLYYRVCQQLLLIESLDAFIEVYTGFTDCQQRPPFARANFSQGRPGIIPSPSPLTGRLNDEAARCFGAASAG